MMWRVSQISSSLHKFSEAMVSAQDDDALAASLYSLLLSLIPFPGSKLDTSHANDSNMSAETTMPYAATPAKQLRHATELRQSFGSVKSMELRQSTELQAVGMQVTPRAKGARGLEMGHHGRHEDRESVCSSMDSLTLYLSPTSSLPSSSRTPPPK
jgi:hypothetical protein